MKNRVAFLILMFGIQGLGFKAFAAGGICVSAPQGTVAQGRYCDGNNWKTMGDGNSMDPCTIGEMGKHKYGLDSYTGINGLMYCDGNNWVSLYISETASACPQQGVIRFDSASTYTLQFCGGNLKWVDTTSTFGGGGNFCPGHGNALACNADPECYWSAGSCQFCPCKR